MASIRELQQLREEAISKGYDDIAENILQDIKEQLPDFSGLSDIGTQGGVAEKEVGERYQAYDRNKKRLVDLQALREEAKEKGYDDIVTNIQTDIDSVTAQILDFEDVTEEVMGAGIALSEGLTVGLIGDEVIAKTYSTLTGEDYDEVLERTRIIEEEFARDNAGMDILIRMGAGFVPATRLAKIAGVGTSGVAGASRQAGAAATEMGVYSFMEGEGGLEQRMEKVAETATNPLAIGAFAVAGTLGGLAGRAVGNDLQLQKELVKARKAEDARLEVLNTDASQGASSRVIEAVQNRADELALSIYNQTGEMPQGLVLGKMYQQLSEEMGVPVNRIIQSEMKAGKKRSDLDYRDQSIKDLQNRINAREDNLYKSEFDAVRSKGFFKDFWENTFESLVNVAKDRVSPAFAGKLQRTATNMAQKQQGYDGLFNTPEVVAFGRVMEADKHGRIMADLLNFSNSRLPKKTREEAFESFKDNLTDEQFAGFEQLRKLRTAQAKDYRQYVFRELPDDPLYFPSRYLTEVNRASFLKAKGEYRSAQDANMYDRKRDLVGPAEALKYEHPVIVMRDKLINDDPYIEMYKNFNLPNTSNTIKAEIDFLGKQIKEAEAELKGLTGKDLVKATKAKEKLQKAYNRAVSQVQGSLARGVAPWEQLGKQLKAEGAQAEVVTVADDILRSLIVDSTKGPKAWLSNFRKAGYVGTIANPYSALLNFGDSANTVVNFGLDNTSQALLNLYKKQGIRVGVEDVGLLNQATGEFLREGASKWEQRFNKLSDLSFEASGFRAADRLGKGLSLNAAVARGQKLAATGQLNKEYGWLFGPTELNLLRRDLLQNRKTQRVKEFAAAELGKLQPSDMAQMPKWYLNHPNGRILYMLRTFGIKQLQQLNRLVAQEWKQGNKKEAVKNGLAYLTVVGGGNSILNELRQPIHNKPAFEEEGFILDSTGNVEKYFVDFMLGVATLNTVSQYNIDKAAKGDAVPLVLAAFPAPVDMTADLTGDMASVIAGEQDIEEFIYEGKGVRWLPFMRTIQPYLED